MAGGAGHGAVRPLQLVGQLLVVLELEADRGEAVDGVAAIAGARRRRRRARGGRGRGEGELAEVGVEVAVGAALELHRGRLDMFYEPHGSSADGVVVVGRFLLDVVYLSSLGHDMIQPVSGLRN